MVGRVFTLDVEYVDALALCMYTSVLLLELRKTVVAFCMCCIMIVSL